MAASRKVRLIHGGSGEAVQGALFPESTTKINFTDSSARNSTPFGADIVRLISDQDCHVKFGGPSVAASTSDMLLKANQPEYFTLTDQYIAAIRSSVSGYLYVTVMI